MRKVLIASILVLLSVTAQARDAPETGDGWRYVVIGTGVLGGIWAANIISASLLMPLGEISSAGPAGGIGLSGMLGGGHGLYVVTRALVTAAAAIAGGYMGAWLHDG
jgi:hypothetical protein